ncbi:hypothetical protein RJ639_023665, partial [Escallonia herrerae]
MTVMYGVYLWNWGETIQLPLRRQKGVQVLLLPRACKFAGVFSTNSIQDCKSGRAILAKQASEIESLLDPLKFHCKKSKVQKFGIHDVGKYHKLACLQSDKSRSPDGQGQVIDVRHRGSSVDEEKQEIELQKWKGTRREEQHMGFDCPSFQIPVINFSKVSLKLDRGSEGWHNLCIKVREACENYGCFEVVYDKILPQSQAQTFSIVKELFALPLEKKLRNVNPNPFHAYAGQFTEAPLYESCAISDASDSDEIRKFVELMWPD